MAPGKPMPRHRTPNRKIAAKIEAIRRRKKIKYDLDVSDLLEKAKSGSLVAYSQRTHSPYLVSPVTFHRMLPSLLRGKRTVYEHRHGKLRPARSSAYLGRVKIRSLYKKLSPILADQRKIGVIFRKLHLKPMDHFRSVQEVKEKIREIMVRYQRLVVLGELETEKLGIKRKHLLELHDDSPKRKKKLSNIEEDMERQRSQLEQYKGWLEEIPMLYSDCLFHADCLTQYHFYEKGVRLAEKWLRSVERGDLETRKEASRAFLRAHINQLRALRGMLQMEQKISRLLGVKIGDLSNEERVDYLKTLQKDIRRLEKEFALLQ
jgi:hypothetical protein